MYKKLLVPMALNHDISPQTLSIAKALSADTGSEIVALHVYETPPASVSTYIDEKLMKDGFEQARRTLDEKLANSEGVTQVLAKGHTYRTIIDYASNNGVDCIVIGSHRPGLSDYLLGSTAARVVRHAPCAVHVYRSS